MKNTIVLGLATIFVLFTPRMGAASPLVQALYLPEGATIRPEGERVLMLSQPGIVAATIDFGDSRRRVAVWRDGKRLILEPATQFETGYSESSTLGALAPGGAVYANAGYAFSGAYSGIKWHTLVYQDETPHEFAFPNCELEGEPGDAIVEGLNGGRLAVTFISPELIQFDKTETGVYAPNAALISQGGCEVIGRATLTAIRGDYAVGFRGYLGKAPAPTNVNRQQQTFKAVRWDGHTLFELGDGVAFDVSSLGIAVGATAPAGDESVVMVSGAGPAGPWSDTFKFGIPHAKLWDTVGAGLLLASEQRSVAYGIDESGRVVGMLRDPDGKHFAFLWEYGSLRRLDDLVQAPRWRFESAYGFTPDGGILGIGTHDGIATAFIVYV